MGIPVSGWDPAFFPDEERTAADVVNLGYVVNVIEDPDERVVVLAAAWELARKVLIVSARLDWEAADAAVDFQSDGIVTGKRTFQKFFTQENSASGSDSGVRHRTTRWPAAQTSCSPPTVCTCAHTLCYNVGVWA